MLKASSRLMKEKKILLGGPTSSLVLPEFINSLLLKFMDFVE